MYSLSKEFGETLRCVCLVYFIICRSQLCFVQTATVKLVAMVFSFACRSQWICRSQKRSKMGSAKQFRQKFFASYSMWWTTHFLSNPALLFRLVNPWRDLCCTWSYLSVTNTKTMRLVLTRFRRSFYHRAFDRY